MKKYDFAGWATRNDLKCADGKTIRRNAFKDNDGATVPLVWNHQHNEPFNVLGHALLENRDEGVYAYCTFNDTEQGRNAKLLVEHGDIEALSIYANRLKQQNGNVLHGSIREVSLVLAGANPGAFIDSVIKHGEESDEEARIFTGESIELYHAEKEEEVEEKETVKEVEKMPNKEKTVADVFNELTDEQKNVVYALIGQALEDAGSDDDTDDEKDDDKMKHNVFDDFDDEMDDVLTHSDMEAIFNDAKRYGSLKDSVLQHGIEQIDYLFPEAKSLNTPPDFLQREMGWVKTVMNGVHRTPFSRIKSMFADITGDEARARGYIKGKLKKEEVFSLLKRTTTPTTIYKKQKLDRDDVVDITDFDVVAWLKAEMRMMLDEEIARAILIGDGRLPSSDDKISEDHIRPIWKDAELYTSRVLLKFDTGATADEKSRALIKGIIKGMVEYEGSGSPTFFTTEDTLTDLLLIEDTTGRRLYNTVDDVAKAMRVSNIVTVPVMKDQTRTHESEGEVKLVGIIVNLKDYNVGADKGGAVNMFDDFDIDYNAQKYLIETRCSGAMIKPHAAIAVEMKVGE